MSIYKDLFDYDSFNDEVRISTLKGQTLKDVVITDNERVIYFYTEEGNAYKMYHEQDCCEHVSIEDIDGDLKSLIGHPILLAEATSNQKKNEYGRERWTFYKLSTIKGHATIRWYGSSNGYYSEQVEIVRGRLNKNK